MRFLKWLFGSFPPSWEAADTNGDKWRVTMITPFDTFYEKLPPTTTKPDIEG